MGASLVAEAQAGILTESAMLFSVLAPVYFMARPSRGITMAKRSFPFAGSLSIAADKESRAHESLVMLEVQAVIGDWHLCMHTLFDN